jgi:hypothetical protein
LVRRWFWLARFDIARRTVRRRGLPRFVTLALLPGYLWLGVGGVLWLRYGAVVAGPAHDAELHALFLGFVFSMIFGHAPVIFPGVLGVATAARWGGLLNATAIGLFLLVTIASAALAHTRRAQAAAPTQLEQPAGAGR